MVQGSRFMVKGYLNEPILKDEYYDELSIEVEKLLEEDFFKSYT